MLPQQVQPEGGEASWNVVQHVAWVLTKLATDPSNKEAVKAAGGITRALQLVKEAAVFVKEEGGEFTLGSSIVPLPIREATWCAAIHMLQSVAHGWPEAQDMLLASGRMEQIVQLLQFGGGDLQEAAASLIHELIDSDAAAEPVEVERRKQTLLSLGVLEPLVQVLTRSPPGGDPGAEKEFAARALANLVDSQASRALVRDAGGVAALVAMLGDEQDEHRDAAVSALEALAKDEELMVQPSFRSAGSPTTRPIRD